MNDDVDYPLSMWDDLEREAEREQLAREIRYRRQHAEMEDAMCRGDFGAFECAVLRGGDVEAAPRGTTALLTTAVTLPLLKEREAFVDVLISAGTSLDRTLVADEEGPLMRALLLLKDQAEADHFCCLLLTCGADPEESMNGERLESVLSRLCARDAREMPDTAHEACSRLASCFATTLNRSLSLLCRASRFGDSGTYCAELLVGAGCSLAFSALFSPPSGSVGALVEMCCECSAPLVRNVRWDWQLEELHVMMICGGTAPIMTHILKDSHDNDVTGKVELLLAAGEPIPTGAVFYLVASHRRAVEALGLLVWCGADVDEPGESVDETGWPIEAIKSREMFTALWHAGADFWHLPVPNKEALLRKCCEYDYAQLAEELFVNGVSSCAGRGDSRSALDIALSSYSYDTAWVLADYGDEIVASYHDCLTPLFQQHPNDTSTAFDNKELHYV